MCKFCKIHLQLFNLVFTFAYGIRCEKMINYNTWFSSVEKLGLNILTKRYHVIYKSSKVDLDWLKTSFNHKLKLGANAVGSMDLSWTTTPLYQMAIVTRNLLVVCWKSHDKHKLIIHLFLYHFLLHKFLSRLYLKNQTPILQLMLLLLMLCYNLFVQEQQRQWYVNLCAYVIHYIWGT